MALPHADPVPGVAWYRTTFSLDIPRDQDVPISLHLGAAAGVGDVIERFVLTGDGELHDRMPVILAEYDWPTMALS